MLQPAVCQGTPARPPPGTTARTTAPTETGRASNKLAPYRFTSARVDGGGRGSPSDALAVQGIDLLRGDPRRRLLVEHRHRPVAVASQHRNPRVGVEFGSGGQQALLIQPEGVRAVWKILLEVGQFEMIALRHGHGNTRFGNFSSVQQDAHRSVGAFGFIRCEDAVRVALPRRRSPFCIWLGVFGDARPVLKHRQQWVVSQRHGAAKLRRVYLPAKEYLRADGHHPALGIDMVQEARQEQVIERIGAPQHDILRVVRAQKAHQSIQVRLFGEGRLFAAIVSDCVAFLRGFLIAVRTQDCLRAVSTLRRGRALTRKQSLLLIGNADGEMSLG